MYLYYVYYSVIGPQKADMCRMKVYSVYFLNLFKEQCVPPFMSVVI